MSATSVPFDHQLCDGVDVNSMTCFEVKEDEKIYSMILKHIASTCTAAQSFTPSVISQGDGESDSCCARDKSSMGRVALTAGLGFFTFPDHEGRTLHALHQAIGNPVSTNCGVKRMTNLVLFSSRGAADLASFITVMIELSERTTEGTFSCYSWHVRHQYWRQGQTCKARLMESVILPQQTKDRLMDDLSIFLSSESKKFYEKHGIPYRRSYLFHGVPGAGKTSLIQAIAGHYKRSVCYLQPTDPDMTDDSLRQAISQLPKNTIVVFEDIDSLFAADRSNKVSKSSLTFSGLLNALDGVGSASGQIFILTTNLRDQLDPALIRNGRVDIHVEFTHATQEQMESMWSSFYPEAAARCQEFSHRVVELLGEKKVATAALQHFFVRNMRQTAEEAMGNLEWIMDDIREKEESEAEAAAKEKASAAAESVTAETAGKKKSRWSEGAHSSAGNAEKSDGNDLVVNLFDPNKTAAASCTAFNVTPGCAIHIHLHGMGAAVGEEGAGGGGLADIEAADVSGSDNTTHVDSDSEE